MEVCILCDRLVDDRLTVYIKDIFATYCECPDCGVPIIILNKHEHEVDDITLKRINDRAKKIWPNSLLKRGMVHDPNHWAMHVEVKY
jgi:hypothetical protein